MNFHDFHIGQQVVSLSNFDAVKKLYPDIKYPNINITYTVRTISDRPEQQWRGITLVELINYDLWTHGDDTHYEEVHFYAGNFAPLDEMHSAEQAVAELIESLEMVEI